MGLDKIINVFSPARERSAHEFDFDKQRFRAF